MRAVTLGRRRSVVTLLAQRVGARTRVSASLGQPGRVAGNAVGNPVGEAVDERGIGIVDDDGESLRARRRSAPAQFGREILPGTRVAVGNRSMRLEGGRGNREIRDVQFLGLMPLPYPHHRAALCRGQAPCVLLGAPTSSDCSHAHRNRSSVGDKLALRPGSWPKPACHRRRDLRHEARGGGYWF